MYTGGYPIPPPTITGTVTNDLVLIDTSPLLVVTDPSVVAARADGVFLTIRVSRNGRPDVERAREILNSLGANVLGVVINGVGGPTGYGYKHYQYDAQYYYDTYGTNDAPASGSA